jgi:oxygen-independent coproporphyrinogen-3 oxidase
LTPELTAAAGRPAYEISNHARPGAECRHNLVYWRYGEYAGVGPGAHGRLTLNGKRFATLCEKLPERWQKRVAGRGHGIAEMTEVRNEDAAREELLMGLRLSEGLDMARWQLRWNSKSDSSRIAALAGDGLLQQEGTRISTTARGRLVLNALLAELAP